IDTIVDTDYQSYASSGRQRHILRGKHQVLRFAQDDKFGKATHCMEGSVGTGEDARLSIALQSYSGNSRSASPTAARGARGHPPSGAASFRPRGREGAGPMVRSDLRPPFA